MLDTNGVCRANLQIESISVVGKYAICEKVYEKTHMLASLAHLNTNKKNVYYIYIKKTSGLWRVGANRLTVT